MKRALQVTTSRGVDRYAAGSGWKYHIDADMALRVTNDKGETIYPPGAWHRLRIVG